QMRSTKDPIRGLERYIEGWGLASADELKVCRSIDLPFYAVNPLYDQSIEKEAKETVNAAVEEAKAAPEPPNDDL
ncbi:hypothetical protein H0H93_007519, partial [Arthromyces matolae]